MYQSRVIRHLLKVTYAVFVIAFYQTGTSETKGTQFGKFELALTEVIVCKGPKLKDCAKVEISIRNKRALLVNVDLHENMRLSNGKIVVTANGKQFLRLQMSDPCNHVFLKPLMQSLLNVSENCIVSKGQYNYIVDIQKVASDYFAEQFVYGNYTFKSTFYNKNCNLSCCKLDAVIQPRNDSNT